ncbi:MAG: hypothetical protein RTU63_14055 [Candidatus Thorarchaeota archaeon]
MHLPFITLKEIDEPEVLSTVPPEVEDLILLSFGNAVMEFEATLYQKFLMLTKGLVITCLEFKEHLSNMEERRIVSSMKFFGKPTWTLELNKEKNNISSW